MSQDFEEQWRRAFEEASDSPSEELWDRIERDLSPERPIGLPFFWIGLVAILLLSLSGWWFWIHSERTSSLTVQVTTKVSPELNASASDTSQLTPYQLPGKNTPAVSGPSVQSGIPGSAIFSTKAPLKKKSTYASVRVSQNSKIGTPSLLPLTNSGPVRLSALSSQGSTLSSLEKLVTLSLAELKNKQWQAYTMTGKLQIPAVSIPVIKKSKTPKYWLGLAASYVRFNPVISTSQQYNTTSNTLIGTTTFASANSAKTSSQADFRATDKLYLSYFTELQAGMQLSRNWYLESGLQFLKGHSTVSTNLVLIDRSTSQKSSLYDQVINGVTTSQLTNNSVVYVSPNTFRYTFEYLSVPINVGYKINPENRLSYFVSGGVSADAFLKNIMADNSYIAIPTATYYPSDGVYRRLVVSALASAGANYRIKPHWSVQVKTFFKKGITDGLTREEVQIHPTTIGIGVGIQRNF
ncbi:MAG: outer membrane beta-barrel protein [Siphonobacter sp.]